MKKYLTGIIAILMAVGFSAFTLQKDKVSQSQKSFTYNNYPDDTWINQPSHYTLFNGTLNCQGGSQRCGVVADDDGTGHPKLSTAVIYTKN